MSQKITIYDIAKRAGVSPATVSRVIHNPSSVKDSTAQKVWDAFTATGITPADLSFRASAQKQTEENSKKHVPTILIIVNSWDNSFFDDILAGIQDYASKQGYRTIVYSSPLLSYHVGEFLEFADSLNISGIITTKRLPEEALSHISNRYPIIQCSEYNQDCQNIPYVTIDDYNISRQAVETLIQDGCERIGFFSAPYEFHYVQERYRAYKSVLYEHHLYSDSSFFISVSDFSFERLLSGASGFFTRNDPPDGLFAVSDLHAYATVSAALSAGFRVPQDIKVVGFDDTIYSILSSPRITTVHQPRRKIGEESTRLLIDWISHPHSIPDSLTLPAEIVKRESA